MVHREEEKGEGTVYLFTRWHQVLVGFEDVSEGFFDVLLFHAREYSGRQEQRQTPLLPAHAQYTEIREGRSATGMVKSSSYFTHRLDCNRDQ